MSEYQQNLNVPSISHELIGALIISLLDLNLNIPTISHKLSGALIISLLDLSFYNIKILNFKSYALEIRIGVYFLEVSGLRYFGENLYYLTGLLRWLWVNDCVR